MPIGTAITLHQWRLLKALDAAFHLADQGFRSNDRRTPYAEAVLQGDPAVLDANLVHATCEQPAVTMVQDVVLGEARNLIVVEYPTKDIESSVPFHHQPSGVNGHGQVSHVVSHTPFFAE